MLLCCLWRNVETSCHKHFIDISREQQTMPLTTSSSVTTFYANDFGILLRSCAQKNYENLSIFVKVTAKKSVAPFFPGHGVE